MNEGLLPTLLVGPQSETEARPRVLVVDRSMDRRLFLRASLQDRCRVVLAPTGMDGAAHLRHCPPRALVIGGVAGRTEHDALRAELQRSEGPATLKLWATRPSPKWPDATLRHPFTRADLIRAVDRVLCGDATKGDGGLGAAGALVDGPCPPQ